MFSPHLTAGARHNGKTMEGIKLICALEEIIQDTRNRRSKARLKDDEGRVTGD